MVASSVNAMLDRLEITRHKPGARVLILSMYDNEEYVFEALAAGASGYVAQDGRRPRPADRAAMRGEPFL